MISPLLPIKFDQNEWFLIIFSIVFLLAYILIPKRLKQSEILFIFLLNLSFASFFDYFLAIKPYDFYDTVDKNSGEFGDILLQFFLYPITMYFIITYYQYIKPKGFKKIYF